MLPANIIKALGLLIACPFLELLLMQFAINDKKHAGIILLIAIAGKILGWDLDGLAFYPERQIILVFWHRFFLSIIIAGLTYNKKRAKTA